MKPEQIPADIGASRHLNKRLGAAILTLGLIPGVPVVTALHYDGLASVVDWPPLFDWLSLFTVLSLAAGVYLWKKPQRVGVDVRFRPGAFTLDMRMPLRKDQRRDLSWSDVTHVLLVRAAYYEDAIEFRLADGTSVSFMTRFLETGMKETFARLRASAEAAGFRLESQRGFHALIVTKEVWRVCPRP